MLVTVAVCTWNRCDRLRQTLEQMTRLAIPGGIDWELLVVDNASDDRTDEVIASFAERLPLRRLYEPTPGLSCARNRAVQEAKGEYIIWTDDDILVGDSWLAAYHAAFVRWPDAAIFGGPIEARLEGNPPPWLTRILPRVPAVYGVQDLGHEPVALTRDLLKRGPYGGNMAFRMVEQARELYDRNMGVRHGRYDIGEETSLIGRLLDKGAEGWWIPNARVVHLIPQSSQSVAYLRRWLAGSGRHMAKQRLAASDRDPPKIWKLWRRRIRAELLYRFHRWSSEPEVWIEHLIVASQTQGQLQVYREESVRQRRSLVPMATSNSP